MAIKLFELLATLSLDTEDFEDGVKAATQSGQKLRGELEDTSRTTSKLALDIADSIGRSIGTVFGSLITAIPQFVSASIRSAREMEAELSKYNSVFGDSVGDADAAILRLSEYSGAYFTRLRSAGTDFYAQFVAGGMESTGAMDMMEQSMMLAADAAAFYDITLEDASQKLRSFLHGNVEAGESIGLFANDVSRTEKAMELYGAKWKELNEAQRETVLLSIAQDAYNASHATGQAGREADSYANRLANIKAIWQNILATLGGPILDVVTPLLTKFEEFLMSNPDAVEDFAKSLGSIASSVGDMLIDVMDYIIENSDEIIALVNSLSSFFAPKEIQFEAKGGFDDVLDGMGLSQAEGAERWRLANDFIQSAERLYEQQDDGEWFLDFDEMAAESAFKAARDAARAMLAPDEYQAVVDYISGIRTPGYQENDFRKRKYSEGFLTEGSETFLDSLFGDLDQLSSAIDGLPGAISAALPDALSGVQVVLNDNIVGVVSAGMARNSRDARYTGANA